MRCIQSVTFWTLLLITSFLASGQSTGQPDIGTSQDGIPGSVQGRVVDTQSGSGVGGVTLHLIGRGVRGASAAPPPVASSSDDGTFRFDLVLPGTYRVLINDPNYASAGDSRSLIQISDGAQVTNLVIRVDPLGTIAGRITDENSSPLAGVEVDVFRAANATGTPLFRQGSATSDKNGSYRVAKILPGRYYVLAAPSSSSASKPATKQNTERGEKGAKTADDDTRLSSVGTYYPKAARFEDASVLDVGTGVNLSDIDVQLRRAATFHVRGRIEATGSEIGRNSGTVLLAPEDNPPLSGIALKSKVERDGSFALDNVQSGAYTLWLSGASVDVGTGRRSSRPRMLARQDVAVNGADVTGIVLALLQPINVTGTVVLPNAETNTSMGRVYVSIFPTIPGMLGTPQNSGLNSAGNFELSNVDPGQYMIRLLNPPSGTYVQSVTFNRQDVRLTGIDLSRGGGGEIEITVRNGAAEVDGTVTDSEGNGAIAAGQVILIPDALAADGTGFLTGFITRPGAFSVRNVPPGHYRALACETWTPVWQYPAFLRAVARDGIDLELAENGHSQIQLRLLTTDQLRSAASAIGLTVQ